MTRDDIHDAAREMRFLHGEKARQKVIDEIVRSVRDQDIDAAKRWNEVGKALDDMIAG
jgi:hypothetical protein